MRRTALCLLGPVFAAAQLVGPGAVTSYTGAGSQSRILYVSLVMIRVAKVESVCEHITN